MADRRRAERRGRWAETVAAVSLQTKGYTILDRRVRTKAGEVDLIARRSNVTAFVEVKLRASIDAALHAVNPASKRRIERAAELWMARRPDLAEGGWRYDIIVVRPWRLPVHVRQAWRPDFAPPYRYP